MMERRPRRQRIECMKTVDNSEEEVDKKIGHIVQGNKKIDEDQVKMIWDLVASVYPKDDILNPVEYDANENVYECGYDNDRTEKDQEVNEDEYQDKYGGAMEWEHMYPIRKSLYNRKTHFISFLQNYTSFAMGRKMMSDYENKMSDFILNEMKPTESVDFLMMLKECKLSNVYRFYDHIFHEWNKKRSSNDKLFEIPTISIDKIIHIFNMFQAFFHRQDKFNRKNFISMRFLLGNILVFMNIVAHRDELPLDLKRPKGRTQLVFHERTWQMFVDSM